MAQIRDLQGLQRHLQLWQSARPARSSPAADASAGPEESKASEAGSAGGAVSVHSDDAPPDSSRALTSAATCPIGYILSLEGADSIPEPVTKRDADSLRSPDDLGMPLHAG